MARAVRIATSYSLPRSTDAGFVFRNIVVLMGVSAQDDADTCASKVQWAADIETRILNAAVNYGVTH